VNRKIKYSKFEKPQGLGKKVFGFDLVVVSGKILYSVENSQGLFLENNQVLFLIVEI
jgi:hypothetical protein